MMDLIDRIIPPGQEGIRVMMIMCVGAFTLFIILLIPAIKIIWSVYRAEKANIYLLTQKSIEHDNEHIVINQNIQSMLVEMKNNRESDNKNTENQRALLLFVARQAGIDIPHL